MAGKDAPIAVFGYDFPHRKTQDFLIELAASGYRNLLLFAAPWKALRHQDGNSYFDRLLTRPAPHRPAELCAALGCAYVEVDHDDAEHIEAARAESDCRLAIIAGARILKPRIIGLFDEGVVNFHPGKIPETSGLDAFFYAIKHQVTQGVTAHYIDGRVDAGLELFFEATPTFAADTPETLQERGYQTQISALRRFLIEREAGLLNPQPVDRPFKNQPMIPEEKFAMLGQFESWKQQRLAVQDSEQFIAACQGGNVPQCRDMLAKVPALRDTRTEQGWTPLIVACYHQQTDVVRLLLEHGADPAVSGSKGTTPLMYAKTALLHRDVADYDLLDLLLDAGATVQQADKMGKTILDYVADKGDMAMHAWLSDRAVAE